MTTPPPGGPPPRTGVMLGSWPLGLPEDGGFYRDLALQVEERGYDLLFTGDHLFMYNPNPEALMVLATYAACTRTITLGTAVLLVPLREPALTAKQLATLDYLSGGRLVVGVGVGGEIEQEWRALEVPVHERGARTDEYLDIMRRLWQPAAVDYAGRFRSIGGVTGSPAPVQPGGPPVWVGGRSDAALQRAARHDGWCAYALTPARVAAGVERLAELRGTGSSRSRISYVLFTYVHDSREVAVRMAGRVLARRYRQDFEPFIDRFCAVGDAATVRARVEAYRSAGVDDILLCPQAPAEEIPEQVDALATALGVAPVTAP